MKFSDMTNIENIHLSAILMLVRSEIWELFSRDNLMTSRKMIRKSDNHDLTNTLYYDVVHDPTAKEQLKSGPITSQMDYFAFFFSVEQNLFLFFSSSTKMFFFFFSLATTLINKIHSRNSRCIFTKFLIFFFMKFNKRSYFYTFRK